VANHPSSCNAADEGEGLSSKRGFRLQPEALEVKVPVGSDWAENATGRKSTWGEAVLFCGTLFSLVQGPRALSLSFSRTQNWFSMVSGVSRAHGIQSVLADFGRQLPSRSTTTPLPPPSRSCRRWPRFRPASWHFRKVVRVLQELVVQGRTGGGHRPPARWWRRTTAPRSFWGRPIR